MKHLPGKVGAVELAEMFDVSLMTITRWVREEQLPFAKTASGHREFDVEKVYSWIENREFSPETKKQFLTEMLIKQATEAIQENPVDAVRILSNAGLISGGTIPEDKPAEDEAGSAEAEPAETETE